jgi:hypothetical protein
MTEALQAAHKSKSNIVSLRGLANVLVRPEFLAILYVIGLLHVYLLLPQLQTNGRKIDFSVYYASALAMRQGLNPYKTDIAQIADKIGLDTNTINRATDPPTFLVCFEPLTLMSPRRAYWTWTWLNLGLLALSLFLLLERRELNPGTVLAIIGLAALYPPVSINFVVAQSKIALLFLLVLMMRFMESEREAAAGVSLAIAGMIRGYPLLLIGYLVGTRRWKVLKYTFVGLAVGGVMTLCLAGIAPTLGFVFSALKYLNSDEWVPFPSDMTLTAFIFRQFWVFGPTPVFRFDLLRRILALVAQATVLALTVKGTLMRAAGRDDHWRALCLWIVTAVLLSPIGYLYDMVPLLLLLVQLVLAGNDRAVSRRALWLAAASYLVPAVMGDVMALLQQLRLFSKMTNVIGFDASRRLWFMLQEYAFFSLFFAYLSAYFFTVDGPEAGVEIGVDKSKPHTPAGRLHTLD